MWELDPLPDRYRTDILKKTFESLWSSRPPCSIGKKEAWSFFKRGSVMGKPIQSDDTFDNLKLAVK